jgi:hypothetical protein
MSAYTTKDLRHQLRLGGYAFPGGYPFFFITADCACLCIKCVKKEYRQISYAIRHHTSPGWRIVGSNINWEDAQLHCDHCSARIESAYAEDA